MRDPCSHENKILREHLWTCAECGLVLSRQRYHASDYHLRAPSVAHTRQSRKKSRSKLPRIERRIARLFPHLAGSSSLKDVVRETKRMHALLSPQKNLDCFVVGCVYILKSGVTSNGDVFIKSMPEVDVGEVSFKSRMVSI